MDAATKVQITGLLYTLVFPLGAAGAILFAGNRFIKGASPPIITGLALLIGALVAVAGGGAPGIPPQDADDWLFYGPLLAGVVGLALDGPGKAAARFAWLAPLLLLPLLGWQIAGRLGALWQDGVATPLATSAWLLDGVAVGVLVWLLVDQAASAALPDGVKGAPLVLGPLALALVGVALATGLTGSARVAQLIGGAAAVVGLIGLAGWRWSAVAPGRAATFAALALLVGGLFMAHFFVDLPRPIAALLLLAPLGVVAAVRVAQQTRKTMPAVVVGAVVSGILVGAALKATLVNEEAKAAAAAKKSGGDDSGVYYPY